MLASSSSATASAAGMTETPGCKEDARVQSSISMACAAVPFASAAQAGAVESPAARTDARPGPPLRDTKSLTAAVDA